MLVMTPNQSDMIRRIPIICFVSYAEDSPIVGDGGAGTDPVHSHSLEVI